LSIINHKSHLKRLDNVSTFPATVQVSPYRMQHIPHFHKQNNWMNNSILRMDYETSTLDVFIETVCWITVTWWSDQYNSFM